MKATTTKIALGVAAAALLALPAHADLVYNSSIQLTGQGFGNAPRALTVQATGNQTTESGCVGIANGSIAKSCISDLQLHDGNGITNVGGSEANPFVADGNKFSIPTLGSLSITSASQIGILYNATEPGGAGAGGTNVTDLTLKIYSGNTLLGAIDGSYDFTSTFTGNGVAGFVFTISPAEQTYINGLLGPNAASDQLALETTITGVHGGPESFSFVNLGSGTIGGGTTGGISAPEPTALALFGSALAGLAGLRRKRRT